MVAVAIHYQFIVSAIKFGESLSKLSLAFHSFIKIGKHLWIFFLICIILFVLKTKKKKEKKFYSYF